MRPRVLVFGSSGQLARELARAGEKHPGLDLTFVDRAQADFTDPTRINDIYRRHLPDISIIAAAYTAVDKAESDEPTAMTVNASAPQAIAEAAAESERPVIHISTDYVFDGTKSGCYVETDAVAPINAYGRTKLAGEVLVRSANPRHLILRTSWIYSSSGTNFVRTMVKLANTQPSVRVVSDQRGCPTAACDLAAVILALIPVALSGDAPWGTYHAAGASEATWHDFAEAIFINLADRGVPRPANIPITTSEYVTPARRPMNSRLSSDLLHRTFGVAPAGWRESLPAVLAEL